MIKMAGAVLVDGRMRHDGRKLPRRQRIRLRPPSYIDWGSPDAFPVGDPRLDKNLIFLDRLHGAVEKQMAARGYGRVVTGRPQLLIHFHANIDRRLNVNAADAQYGYCLDDACRDGVPRSTRPAR